MSHHEELELHGSTKSYTSNSFPPWLRTEAAVWHMVDLGGSNKPTPSRHLTHPRKQHQLGTMRPAAAASLLRQQGGRRGWARVAVRSGLWDFVLVHYLN
ncbi:hypothetical protein ABZP36_016788 [Zizania latifolia]